MTATLIGDARCFTNEQARWQILYGRGVAEARIRLDHCLTGTGRARQGFDRALAAVRAGNPLIVPEHDRLARVVRDSREIGDGMAARGVKLSLGGTIYDPAEGMTAAKTGAGQ
ncbi:recombinase family protein [Nocardia amamiensis]|uniref:recombinase family protein n=1 Tax=Nocardia amamiensis TaxID=404578 RepID=UPI00082E22E9|nr:recombinase family protein [Nocardia amamiensis]